MECPSSEARGSGSRVNALNRSAAFRGIALKRTQRYTGDDQRALTIR